MLVMRSGNPDQTAVAPVRVNPAGAFIDTAGGQSKNCGDLGGDGGIVLSGCGQIAFPGTNSYAGDTVPTENTTLAIANDEANGGDNGVLMGGMLQAVEH